MQLLCRRSLADSDKAEDALIYRSVPSFLPLTQHIVVKTEELINCPSTDR